MTKADNTELATIRRHVASWEALGYTGQYASTLLRLLDQAIAERDAVMAALWAIVVIADDFLTKGRERRNNAKS